MENMQSKNLQEENKNETITELAHRHLTDESHTTTDEELKNAKLVLTENVKADEGNLFEVDNTTIIPPLPGENSDKTDDDENDNKDEKPMSTPFDILGG